jgi:DNA-directed RNA polymerase specialized sigma24 family protein
MVQCAQKLVGKNDAQAVANEALYDAYCPDRAKPPVENDDAVRCWLRTLVYWRARAYWKREKPWKLVDLLSFDIPDELYDVDATHGADVVIDRIVLMSALNELNDFDRTLVLEYYVGGFTAGELALKYEKNEPTIRTRIARATEKLMGVLDKQQQGNSLPPYLVVFLEPSRDGLLFKQFTTTLRSGMAKCAQFFSLQLGGVALCLLMPGDISGVRQEVEIELPNMPNEESFTPSYAQRFAFDWTITSYSIAQKSRPSASVPLRVIARPPNVAKPHDSTSEPVAPSELTPPIKKWLPNAADACSTAFAEAQTAFRLRQDAVSCIDYLNRVPTGFDACPESDPRKFLRQVCENGLLSNK